jgi:hypothetical protein
MLWPACFGWLWHCDELQRRRGRRGSCIGARDAWSRAACGEAPGARLLTSRVAISTSWDGREWRPSRRGCDGAGKGRGVSPRSIERCGHRGLCPCRRAFAGAIFSVARDGDSSGRREPPHGRVRGTVPRPGIAKSKAPQPICQVGRDTVIAVRENIGRRGLRPSQRAFARPIFSIVEDGDSPGRPKLPHVRAQRTVPLPGWRPAEGILRLWPSCNGWRACDAHAAGTMDRAPPRALPRCTAPGKLDRPGGSRFWRSGGAVEPPRGLHEVGGGPEHWRAATT